MNLLGSGNQETWEDENDFGAARRKRIESSHQIVYDMWEAGIRSIPEISSESGYTPNYVRMLLRDRGYSPRTKGDRSVEENDDICKAYEEGMPVRHILFTFKLSNTTLYDLLASRGIPIRRSSKSANLNEAIRLYVNNTPIKDITALTNVTPSVLYGELAILGIPQRTVKSEKGSMDEAIEMYQKGVKLVEIHLHTGITSTMMYLELARRGISARRGEDFNRRVTKALQMYEVGRPIESIYAETKVSTAALYRAIRFKGMKIRNRASTGQDESLALELYDQGAPAREIMKASKIGIDHLMIILKERGQPLRTGLSPNGGGKNLALAIQGYTQGIDVETIEIDTLVSRVHLYAELKKRNITIRP